MRGKISTRPPRSARTHLYYYPPSVKSRQSINLLQPPHRQSNLIYNAHKSVFLPKPTGITRHNRRKHTSHPSHRLKRSRIIPQNLPHPAQTLPQLLHESVQRPATPAAPTAGATAAVRADTPARLHSQHHHRITRLHCAAGERRHRPGDLYPRMPGEVWRPRERDLVGRIRVREVVEEIGDVEGGVEADLRGGVTGEGEGDT